MPYCYEFEAPDGCFGVTSEVDLAGPLKLYVGAWPWRSVPVLAQTHVEVARQPEGGMRLHLTAQPQINRPTEYVIESASGVLDMLTRLCLEQLGPYGDLHAGSALIDGKLIVLPGESHAGKSTLALQLAARGHVLGGDDRLLMGPLTGAAEQRLEGVLLGLNARLRFPLDRRGGEAFARFVDERRLAAEAISPALGFIAPRAGELAPFGHRAPLAAIVVPLRQDSGGNALERAAFSEIMRLLLEQLHAPHLPAAQLTQAVRQAALSVPGYVLRFEDSARAAQMIEALAQSGFGDLSQ
ncbi:MAG: hypothetical protein AB7R90_21435 [Reyranellaceae bacterium]